MTREKYSVLLERVKAKREALAAYVSRLLPRKRRLTNLTIICGSAATVLTAAPALGGMSVTSWLAASFGLTAPVWQVLCAGAALCSAVATISTQLLKSYDIEAKLAKAQAAAARLEGIVIGLQSGDTDVQEAAAEYTRCVEDTAFIQTGGAAPSV